MPATRHARLFRNGCYQAVRIPRDFELSGTEVIIYRDGVRLIIEPFKKESRLLQVLSELSPVDDEFPNRKDGLLPVEDVNL